MKAMKTPFISSWKSTLLLALLCLLLTPADCSIAGEKDGHFDVYWIDVEGGAATLLVTPAGESLLIDTGNPGVRDPNRIVRVASQQAGLRRIDHLITTHYHRDHYGGAALLSKLMPIGTVYDNGIFEGMPDDPGREYFEFECEKRVVIHPGDEIPLKQKESSPAISIRCLGTRQTFIEPGPEHSDNQSHCADCQPKERDGSDNANSVVMLTSFGEFRLFNGGDLTWNQEMKLVCPRDLIGPVDVYQVTHHGLDSSNNPVVLKTIQPRVAVMNNGHRKGCLPEVFANLKATESIAAIFQVHKNLRPGEEVNNVEDHYIANHLPSEQCDGHPIQLSVAPDSHSYTVSIPANQFSQTFETRPK
jgi:competence protein ComEC